MDERNPLHVVLGIIGLLGALLYVLACRPSWSPDSSKVLFTYCNPQTNECGVAVYYRASGAVTSLFSHEFKGDNSGYIPSAVWGSDGQRAIVLWGEKGEREKKNPATRETEKIETRLTHVEVLPLGTGEREMHFKLRDFQPSDGVYVTPLAESGGKLYLTRSGGNEFLRLDLKTGKQDLQDSKDEREPLFYSRNGHVAYVREGAESSDDLEFGALEPRNLRLHALFTLKKQALVPYGVDEYKVLLAFEPHGARLAMPALAADERDVVLICNDRGLERVLRPEISAKAYRLGNLEWSRDGKILYGTVITPTEDEKIRQYSLAEIAVEGGPARLVPIVRSTSSADESWMQFQISLSPDGSTIAASTAHFDKDKIEPADRGLFLVDLRDPQRKVTKIQYPPMQPAVAKTSKE
jgi:hypothetical protein